MLSYHPRTPCLLGLDRWFCRDLRKKIYSYMSESNIGIVKLAYKMTSVRDSIRILRNTCRLEVFRMVAEMHMLDGRCTISYHANEIMKDAIGRNDLEFVKYVHSVMFCDIDLSMLKSYDDQMFDWVLENATRRRGTHDSIAITPHMRARLHAIGYEAEDISSMGVGRGCEPEDIMKCEYVSYAVVGVIRSARWEVLTSILDTGYELTSLAEKELIRHAPDAIFNRCIKHMPTYGHMRAWKHSPERAARALELDDTVPIIVKHEAHAKLCIAHGRKPMACTTKPHDTWQLDLGMYNDGSWYKFDSMHYPRLHTLIALPKYICHSMTLPQMRWLRARGVIFSKNFSMNVIQTYEHVEFILNCYKPDWDGVQITSQDPATVQLMHDNGWTVTGKYLTHVYRVDTFRWLLNKFGAYPEIYELIDQLDIVLHEELYAVCKPPANAMTWTKSIHIAQWLHRKGLVYDGVCNTPLREFMKKHFYHCAGVAGHESAPNKLCTDP
jgi:hypothetical protein